MISDEELLKRLSSLISSERKNNNKKVQASMLPDLKQEEEEEARQLFEMLDEQPPKKETKKRVTFAVEEQKQYIIYDQQKKWKDSLAGSKKGRFDPAEKRKLLQSLTQCIAEANISYETIVNVVTEEADEKIPRNLHLWTKICSVLPDRSLVSCYKFLKREISGKKGSWSEQQTQTLKQLIQQHGRKWSIIAKSLGRTPQNVRDRFRTLGEENDEERIKSVWKLQTLVDFLKLLQIYTNVNFLKTGLNQELQRQEEHDQAEQIESRKRKRNSKSFMFHNNFVVKDYLTDDFKSLKLEEIKWKKISQKLKIKTVFDCRNKFVQLLQFQLKNTKQTKNIDKKIVELVSGGKFKNQQQINWQKETSGWQIDSIEVKNRWMVLRKQIEGRSQKTFSEIVSALKGRYLVNS